MHYEIFLAFVVISLNSGKMKAHRRGIKNMWRIASLALVLVGLSGCFRLDGEGPVSDSVNFLVDRVVNRPKPPMRPVDPIYCYRTLAVVDCTAEPMLGEDRRLVNNYGPRAR